MKSTARTPHWPRPAALFALLVPTAATRNASAAGFTEPGTLAPSGDGFTSVADPNFFGVVTLQTFGFGGATYAASRTAPAGGWEAAFTKGTADIVGSCTAESSAFPAAMVNIPVDRRFESSGPGRGGVASL